MRTSISILAALLLLVAPAARAEWRVSAGTQHFNWVERTSPLEVKESGPLFGLGTHLAQNVAKGWLPVYRADYFVGQVAYDGANLFAQTVAASGNTVYFGTTQEGQLRYRAGESLDAIGALGLDLWRRRLSASQMEDYRIVSVRLGAEHRAPAHDPWRLAAGVKWTVSTREDAHFTALGFDNDPILTPGESVSPYGEAGYTFGRRWTVIASYDAFHFGRSDPVRLSKRRAQTVSYQPASDMRRLGIRLEYGR
jgi:hypothetical protein